MRPRAGRDKTWSTHERKNMYECMVRMADPEDGSKEIDDSERVLKQVKGSLKDLELGVFRGI